MKLIKNTVCDEVYYNSASINKIAFNIEDVLIVRELSGDDQKDFRYSGKTNNMEIIGIKFKDSGYHHVVLPFEYFIQ